MRKIKIKSFEKVGSIVVPEGVTSIDITDPCYEKDVWCRMTADIEPGQYNCFVWKRDGRILKSALLKAGVDPNATDLLQEEIGFIDVDAGLAGYFINKPDYGYNNETEEDEWHNVCKWTWSFADERLAWVHDESTPMKCIGFFTESGYGDGEYFVYEITNSKNEFVGYAIEF